MRRFVYEMTVIDEPDGPLLTTDLNDRGALGWELVAVTEGPLLGKGAEGGLPHTHMIWKREVDPPMPRPT